jgi:ATP-dependent DNA ligase
VAQAGSDMAGGALDGVVAKRRDGPYEPGERAMLKIKQLRTADCVVGGFRYAAKKREVGSLLLGLFNDAGQARPCRLHLLHSAAEDKAELTKRLEALVEAPGFTGDAPGGPSRWATERSGDWQPLRPSWSPRCATTMSPATASATAPSSCAGGRQGAGAVPDGPARA